MTAVKTDRHQPFYDDLGETLLESWRMLERGVADRRHGFHHPVLATIGVDGSPEARTVILRKADQATRSIIIHTDQRSQKIMEMTAAPRVALHCYDPQRKIQLRLNGTASLHHGDEIAAARWQASQRMSRVCYSIAPGPGVAIDQGGAFTLRQHDAAAPEHTVPGFENFVAVIIRMDRLEWLFLAVEGHRRARFNWRGDDAVSSTWLAP